MSKANWVLANPASGSGDKTINVSSSSQHTGRTARASALTITAADCEPLTVAVNQAGKPEHADYNSDTATAVKAGQTLTISGIANSTKLTFSIGTSGNTLGLTAPTKYTAAGIEVNNGTAITGDPGASAEYNWSIQFIIGPNDTITTKGAQVIVTDAAGNTDTCTITQAAGDARIAVSKDSLDLTWQGTAVSFNISSNTSWTIS